MMKCYGSKISPVFSGECKTVLSSYTSIHVTYDITTHHYYFVMKGIRLFTV